MIRLLRAIANWLEKQKQRRCRHPRVRSVADAWDFQYWCPRCGRDWPLNTHPLPKEYGEVVEP